MLTITLRNDFHNSAVSLRVSTLPATLSPAQTKRVDRELCGVTGCDCGTIRGPQPHGTEFLTWDEDYIAGNQPGRAQRVYIIRERGAF